MTAWIADRRKLATLAAIGGIAVAAILYAVWREASRPDYAADTAKYLKGVSAPPQSIDVTVPASPPFMPRTSIFESAPFAQPRAALPTDQEDPPRRPITWTTPQPVFVLPEIQTPPEIKNLTGLDKIPDLSVPLPGTSFSMPALPAEPSGTAFRLILPGATPTDAIGSPTGLPASIPSGALGTATGLLKR